MRHLLVPSIAVLVLAASAVLAQAQTDAEAPGVEMVRKGVFDLRLGQSKDLTDRAILVNLVKVPGAPGELPKRIDISINGSPYSLRAGQRVDLKDARATRDFVKDLGVCVLDVVSAANPVGGQPTARFRLMCD